MKDQTATPCDPKINSEVNAWLSEALRLFVVLAKQAEAIGPDFWRARGGAMARIRAAKATFDVSIVWAGEQRCRVQFRMLDEDGKAVGDLFVIDTMGDYAAPAG